jgi:hypothetical protein
VPASRLRTIQSYTCASISQDTPLVLFLSAPRVVVLPLPARVVILESPPRIVPNPFGITYIRKNASVTPLGTHTSETKDLKSRRITYLQKKGAGAPPSTGRRSPVLVPGHDRCVRVPTPVGTGVSSCFRLSTVDCGLSTASTVLDSEKPHDAL